MNAGLQFLPPRSVVIFALTRKMLDETALCVRKFAMLVAENYFKSTAVDRRALPFKWGTTIDELCKAEKANAQIIARYMDGTVKTLPCDLEDAWVRSLPEPYQNDCERDLASRRGMLTVRFPEFSGKADVVNVATLVKDFSELLSALAPVLNDGVIDESDAPHARKILRESDDLIAQIMSVRAVVSDVLLVSQINRAVKKGTHCD